MKPLPGGREHIVRSGQEVERTGGMIDRRNLQEGTGPQYITVSPLVGVLLQRARMDFFASLLTLAASAMCLGLAFMYFDLLGMPMAFALNKMHRWLAASLPIGAIIVFAVSFTRMTPWFAGILAGLVASLVPAVGSGTRLVLVVVLSVVFGAADAFVRWRVRQHG